MFRACWCGGCEVGPARFATRRVRCRGRQERRDVRRLLTLADETENLDVSLRACRYPHRVKLWKGLPADQFVSYQEPGDCQGAAPKEVRLAETTTVLKGESQADAVRTIVCRQVIPGPKKDRWHPLYTSRDAEQACRVKCWRSSVNVSTTSRATGWKCTMRS